MCVCVFQVAEDEMIKDLLMSWATEYVQHAKAGGRPGASKRKSWLGVVSVPQAPPHVELHLAADAANVPLPAVTLSAVLVMSDC